MRVHRRLGPGLLEHIYEKCLYHELTRAEIPFRHQVTPPVIYDGEYLEGGYVADIIIADEVILEIKSVESLLPVHQAQLVTYLRLLPSHIGVLLNFNTVLDRWHQALRPVKCKSPSSRSMNPRINPRYP
jgi:GxxExxY protein